MEECTNALIPSLAIHDLVIAEGRRGAEQILVPGLGLSVAPGESVALCAPRPAAAALLDVLRGRRRARYGWVSVLGRTLGGCPVRPRVPSGLAVVDPGQFRAENAAVLILDGRSGSRGALESWPVVMLTHARRHGTAALIIHDAPSAPTAWHVDREVGVAGEGIATRASRLRAVHEESDR